MNGKRVLFAVVVSLVVRTATDAEIPVGRFVDVKPVVPLGEGTFRDCCNPVSPDGKLLMFSNNNRPGRMGGFDIFQVSRTSTNEPFGPPTPVSGLNTSSTDAPSGFSSDGKTLFFYSSRPEGHGRNDIWMATRSSLSDPFGDVTNLGPGVNSTSGDSEAVVSNDGTTLYFNTDRDGGDYDLWQATRNLDGDFVNAMAMENVNSTAHDGGPTVSKDGLHLFFGSSREGQGELFAASRTRTDEPFGEPVNLNNFSLGSSVNAEGVNELTPYISADWPAVGSKLYFTRVVNPNNVDIFSIPDWDIYEATWVPEPSSFILALIVSLCLATCRRSHKPCKGAN